MLFKPVLPLAESITNFMKSIFKLKYNLKKKIPQNLWIKLSNKITITVKRFTKKSHAMELLILIIFLLEDEISHRHKKIMASISVFCNLSQKLMNLLMKYEQSQLLETNSVDGNSGCLATQPRRSILIWNKWSI